MSLLTLVQTACDRLGIQMPGAVMSSNDETIRVMRALATQEGRELARRVAWQNLTKESSFTTVASETQPGAIPADFDRFINETAWNYTQNRSLIGPVDPQQWQQLKASLVGPPWLHFRQRGNAFLIIPNPPAGENVRFEYVSRFWVDTNNDGLGEADAWANDANTALLNEELITLGIIWRWLKRNRLPYNDELQEYQAQVNQAIGRDGGKRTVSMGGQYDPAPRVPSIQDGSWPL